MPAAAGIYYAQSEAASSDSLPIILLHGAGGDHSFWPAAIRRLNGQRVFALDLPGHGRSEGVGLQSIAAYADQVLDFLTACDLYQAVWIGHGMGGAIALEIAIRQPARAAGLGLISTGAYLGVSEDLLQGFANPINMPVALHAFRKRAFAAATPETLAAPIMRVMRSTRSSVTASDWYASSRFDRRSDVGLIHAPAWIMTGTEDQITPVAYAHFLSENLPAARLQVINGVGHMAIVEAPTLVASGIQQFLTSLAIARQTSAQAFPSRIAVPAQKPERARVERRRSKRD